MISYQLEPNLSAVAIVPACPTLPWMACSKAKELGGNWFAARTKRLA